MLFRSDRGRQLFDGRRFDGRLHKIGVGLLGLPCLGQPDGPPGRRLRPSRNPGCSGGPCRSSWPRCGSSNNCRGPSWSPSGRSPCPRSRPGFPGHRAGDRRSDGAADDGTVPAGDHSPSRTYFGDGREPTFEGNAGFLRRRDRFSNCYPKKTRARTSMLSRGGAPGASGFSNEVWNDSRARPSLALS